MPACVECGQMYEARGAHAAVARDRDLPGRCRHCMLRAYARQTSVVLPVQQAPAVPIKVTFTLKKNELPPPKLERVTRYDILSRGGLDLGVHFDEGSNVDKP